MDPKGFARRAVAIVDLESRPVCVYRDYIDPEEERNGGTCLYFEKPEVERMAT